MSKENPATERLPVLPLRDTVVFPGTEKTLSVGRPASINALEEAIHTTGRLVAFSQKDPAQDEPRPDDLANIGTLCTILQAAQLPDGTYQVLVRGEERVGFKTFYDIEDKGAPFF